MRDAKTEWAQREWAMGDGEGGVDVEKPDVSFTLLCWISECGSQPNIPLHSLLFGFSDTPRTQGLMSGFYSQHLSAALRQHNTNRASLEHGTRQKQVRSSACLSARSCDGLKCNKQCHYASRWLTLAFFLLTHRLNTERSVTWPARLCSRWWRCGCWPSYSTAPPSSSGRPSSARALSRLTSATPSFTSPGTSCSALLPSSSSPRLCPWPSSTSAFTWTSIRGTRAEAPAPPTSRRCRGSVRSTKMEEAGPCFLSRLGRCRPASRRLSLQLSRTTMSCPRPSATTLTPVRYSRRGRSSLLTEKTPGCFSTRPPARRPAVGHRDLVFHGTKRSPNL